MWVRSQGWNLGVTVLAGAVVGCGPMTTMPDTATGADGATGAGGSGDPDPDADESPGSEGGGDSGSADAGPGTSSDSSGTTGAMAGDECVDSSDCPDVQSCFDGVCRCGDFDAFCHYYDDYECRTDADCPPGSRCHSGRVGYYAECSEVVEFPGCDEADAPTLVPLPDIWVGEGEVISLSFVDADADGGADLVVSRTDGVTVHMASGALPAAVPLPPGTTVAAAASGDYDGDGVPDMALALGDAGLALVLGDGAGGWTEGTVGASTLTDATDVGTVRFNADAVDDVAVAGPQGTRVLFGGAVGGLDGDLILDHAPSGALSITASGVVPAIVSASTPGNVQAWEAAPDADGAADAWVAHTGVGLSIPLVSVDANDGDRVIAAITPERDWSEFERFGSNTSTAILYPVIDARVGDLDGDGRNDFVVAGADRLEFLRVVGSTVACKAELLDGSSVAAIAVGDHTADGRADVAVAAGGNVTVFASVEP